MNAVADELGSSEAGHQVEVGWAILEDAGELGENIGKTVTVPQRRLAIHRRRDQEHQIRTRRSSGGQDRQELEQDGLDPEANGATGVLGSGEEVGDARHDAHVGLGTNGTKTLGKQG